LSGKKGEVIGGFCNIRTGHPSGSNVETHRKLETFLSIGNRSIIIYQLFVFSAIKTTTVTTILFISAFTNNRALYNLPKLGSNQLLKQNRRHNHQKRIYIATRASLSRLESNLDCCYVILLIDQYQTS